MNVITICYKDDGTDCYWVLLNRKLQSVMKTEHGAVVEAQKIAKHHNIEYRLEHTVSHTGRAVFGRA